MQFVLFYVCCLLVLTFPVFGILFSTPPIIWTSNKNCELTNSATIYETAHLLSSLGFSDVYILLDDCWLQPYRSMTGNLVVRSDLFPGTTLKEFVDDVKRSFGVKIGLGMSVKKSCRNAPGIEGHERSDVDQLVGYGIDLIYVDGCGSFDDPSFVFESVSRQLNRTGEEIGFGLCNWNKYKNEPIYGPQIANLWCISSLFSDSWFDFNMKSLDAEKYRLLGRPGGWNMGFELAPKYADDLSRLRLVLSFQAIFNQPIILNDNIVNSTAEYVSVIRNQFILNTQKVINYPPGRLIYSEGNTLVYAKQVGVLDFMILIVNYGSNAVFFHLKYSYFYHYSGYAQHGDVTDVWKGSHLGSYYNQYSFVLPAFDQKTLYISLNSQT